ncbi:hypothetical protein AB0M54_39210 [Actinoplanes sp. NPDC051470]|uniref:hypothetical protein n=1 Tax=unclassified Actinoplanes TaxID=2626549 RepID=UPI003425E5E4
MASGMYVEVPRELRADLEELDIVVSGPHRGAVADVLVSIGVVGGALGATADVVTVLMGRAEVTRLARRIWARARRRDETKRIVLEVRQGADRLNVTFEVTGPETKVAAEVFAHGLAGAFAAVLEDHNRDQ